MRIYFEKLVLAEWSFYNQYDYVFYHIFPLVYCFWFLPVFAHWMHQFGWSEFSIDRSVFVEQFVKIFDGASLFVPFSPIMQMTDRRHLWINLEQSTHQITERNIIFYRSTTMDRKEILVQWIFFGDGNVLFMDRNIFFRTANISNYDIILRRQHHYPWHSEYILPFDFICRVQRFSS